MDAITQEQAATAIIVAVATVVVLLSIAATVIAARRLLKEASVSVLQRHRTKQIPEVLAAAVLTEHIAETKRVPTRALFLLTPFDVYGIITMYNRKGM